MLLIVHFALCCFMTGLIWQIQLNHYPLFAFVGRQDFQAYQARHMQTITWIVAPVMTAELITGLLLLKSRPESVFHLILLGCIWLSTAILQVPLHQKLLLEGYNPGRIRLLVKSNWLRTILWTLRTILLCHLVAS